MAAPAGARKPVMSRHIASFRAAHQFGRIWSEADINHRAGFYTPFCNGPGDVKSPQVIIASPSSRFCPWSKLRPPHCAVRGSGKSI